MSPSLGWQLAAIFVVGCIMLGLMLLDFESGIITGYFR
jgi:hypothetical protein